MELRESFRLLDADDNGYITEAEMRSQQIHAAKQDDQIGANFCPMGVFVHWADF
jgi:Ca2+-binding EF-hand superfamily protein